MVRRIARRARFRFGLRAVFLLLTVAAVVFGWQAYRAARREAAAVIRDRGGSIQFESAGPTWLVRIVGHELTSRAVRVSIPAPCAAELAPYLFKLRSLREIEFQSSEDSRTTDHWMKVPEFFAFRQAIHRLADELPATKLTFESPACFPMDDEWDQVRTDLDVSDRTLPAGLEGEWLSIWFVATTDGGYVDLIGAELDDGTNRIYLVREGELMDTLSLTGGPSAWRLTDVNRDQCADLEGIVFRNYQQSMRWAWRWRSSIGAPSDSMLHAGYKITDGGFKPLFETRIASEADVAGRDAVRARDRRNVSP